MTTVADNLDKTKVYVGFQKGTNWIAKPIEFFTKSVYSHSFLLLWDEKWNGWLALGADAGGWIFTPGESEQNVDLYEVSGLDIWKGLVANRHQLGAPYDFAGLFGMSVVEVALHWFKSKVKNPLWTKGTWWCSEILLKVLSDSGLTLPVIPGESDPQQVKDALTKIPGVLQVATYVNLN